MLSTDPKFGTQLMDMISEGNPRNSQILPSLVKNQMTDSDREYHESSSSVVELNKYGIRPMKEKPGRKRNEN